MSNKVLMKGNEAIGEAAISAGCRYFFGYPITPQSERPAYLARRMRQVNGVFLQAESEVAAINMVYGAASAGARAMTSSSSPGISLKQEGISYLCGAELPCLVVNVMRGGPGLGTIQPSQSDYFQAVKGGGHGDYHTIVLAPSSIQEIVDLIRLAFELADRYRNPSLILADGTLGQMMEPVEFGDYKPSVPEKPWATTGCKGRAPNIVTSIYIQPDVLEDHNHKLQAKYKTIREAEQRAELWMMDDAELMVAAYGTVARIAKTAIRQARARGVKVGLFRPITLWPFPEDFFRRCQGVRGILTVELSAGQMVEDIRLCAEGRMPVEFYGRLGGMVPSIEEVYLQIMTLASRLGQPAARS